MTETIHVACATDDRYAPYCMAMLDSLLARHDEHRVTIHLLHAPGLSEPARSAFVRLVDSRRATLVLERISDERLADLPTLPRIGEETWFRVLLPELKPTLDRILYLDADTLIVNDLEPLWAMDMAEHPVAAVSNVMERRFANRAVELGLPPGTAYFNAGVLLMNLDLMRRERCPERVLSYARINAERLALSDQDALNAVLGARRLPLHPRWNCQNSLFTWPRSRAVFGDAIDEAKRSPAILHFEGPASAKPWHFLSDHPFRARYLRHLRAIPFPVPPTEGRTLKNSLIKVLPRGLAGPIRRQVRRLRSSLGHDLAQPTNRDGRGGPTRPEAGAEGSPERARDAGRDET